MAGSLLDLRFRRSRNVAAITATTATATPAYSRIDVPGLCELTVTVFEMANILPAESVTVRVTLNDPAVE